MKCKRVEEVPVHTFPMADVYYWWPSDAGLNVQWLRTVEHALRSRRRRATVFIGFDSQCRPDMDWLPIIATQYNATVTRLFFDEGGAIDTAAMTSTVYARATNKFHASIRWRYHDRLGHWGVFLLAKIELGHATLRSLPRSQLTYRPKPPPLEFTIAGVKLADATLRNLRSNITVVNSTPVVNERSLSDHLLLQVPSRELRQQQCSSLRALAAFEEVSRVLGITYTLCGGSAVGAMQWSSMLPWDDDIDLILPRADFSILVRQISKWIEHSSAAEEIYDEGPMTWAVLPLHLVGGDEGNGPRTHSCLPGSGRFEMGWPNEKSAATSSNYMRLLKMRETHGGSSRCMRVLDPYGFPFGTVDIITTTDAAEHLDQVESLSYDIAAPIEQCAGASKCAPVPTLFGGVPARILPTNAMVQHLNMAYHDWRTRIDAWRWRSPVTMRAPYFLNGLTNSKQDLMSEIQKRRGQWDHSESHQPLPGRRTDRKLRKGLHTSRPEECMVVRWHDIEHDRARRIQRLMDRMNAATSTAHQGGVSDRQETV